MLSVLFRKYKVKPFGRDRQSQHLMYTHRQKQIGTHRDKQIYKIAFREAQIQTHARQTDRQTEMEDTEHEVKNSNMDSLSVKQPQGDMLFFP